MILADLSIALSKASVIFWIELSEVCVPPTPETAIVFSLIIRPACERSSHRRHAFLIESTTLHRAQQWLRSKFWNDNLQEHHIIFLAVIYRDIKRFNRHEIAYPLYYNIGI
ncbi:hypothetical protein probably linked to type III secretion (plasmid) [Sinorhizobium fredii NGR234]|uniref:Uncharacterized protein n=1 Tax=Sinorhizobium fredii (strain NBRC 101917 / NGR234) TaxID=394 RepID=C3KNA3_SINFN|nr:hypothetical protein probably linked to type III secretion [Sinorhizobium fredii NGR234]